MTRLQITEISLPEQYTNNNEW